MGKKKMKEVIAQVSTGNSATKSPKADAYNDIAIFIGDNIERFENIDTITIRRNWRTGERIGRFTDTTGKTTIRLIGENDAVGVKTLTDVHWRSREERENAIVKLLQNEYLQDEIADIVGVSQGTVSNIKRKFEEQKKQEE